MSPGKREQAGVTMAQTRIDPAKTFAEAAALHAQGRLGEAESRYQAVLSANARHFDALYRLGLIRLQQGRFDEAADFFRRALKVERKSADALLHLGVALTGSKRFDEAIRHYEKALALQPSFPEAHNNLGYTLQQLGRSEAAVAHYEQALALRPGYAEAWNNLGLALHALGRAQDALVPYEKAIALAPHYLEARNNLGGALRALGRYEEAAEQYNKVVAANPRHAEAHNNLGIALWELGREDDAVAHYRHALAADPDHAEAHSNLGKSLQMLGRSDEAIAHMQRAVASKPGDATLHGNLGSALRAAGKLKEAVAAFEASIALAPRGAGHYWNFANARRFAADDRHVAAMIELARDEASLSADERIDLHFALGKVLADVGDHRGSFQHLLKGNALRRQQTDYDEAAALGRLARIRAVFSAELFQRKLGLGDPSRTPIFILGMPRSGTTLIEQILASHPQVFGAGELRYMAAVAGDIRGANDAAFPEAVPDLTGEALRDLGANYLRAIRPLAPDAGMITDKMPGNFSHVGLIRLALPNARIIHASRDLRDVALSCFSLLFSRGHDFSYDLAELGRFCRAYQELMDHWEQALPEGVMLKVQYEDLVGDLEGHARHIVTHCGLPWDDACLRFHETERPVLTASATQVRRPLYQSSVGRWRAHEAELRPLLQALNG
jgi:tetratricopeptide (TPR) repeat protein